MVSVSIFPAVGTPPFVPWPTGEGAHWFIHSTVGGHLGRFQVLMTLNKTSENVHMCLLMATCTDLLDSCSEMELLGLICGNSLPSCSECAGATLGSEQQVRPRSSTSSLEVGQSLNLPPPPAGVV